MGGLVLCNLSASATFEFKSTGTLPFRTEVIVHEIIEQQTQTLFSAQRQAKITVMSLRHQ